eukprot:834923-Lingulodinium_polyedra.AAC.1
MKPSGGRPGVGSSMRRVSGGEASSGFRAEGRPPFTNAGEDDLDHRWIGGEARAKMCDEFREESSDCSRRAERQLFH